MKRLELITDLARIRQNASEIRKRIPQNVHMMCVVKADAYGHGAAQTAGTLHESGLADAFAVATCKEGRKLRQNIKGVPVLVLGLLTSDEDAKTAVDEDLTQAISTPREVRMLAQAASRAKKNAQVHIKVDTGMSRVGARGQAELAELLDALKPEKNLFVTGLFSHLCAADEDEEYTLLQKARFDRAAATVKSAGYDPVCHLAASTAMLKEGFGYGMVRAGIGLYGTGVKELEGAVKPAQTLLSHPVAFRNIDKGDTVGYGRCFTAERPTRIMTVPCGYGDGYPRILSGKSCVLVNGRRVKIVGNICMDMLMADVTGIPDISFSSKVTLMGEDGGERITPDELADLAETIPYEIMLGFSVRAERSWTDTERE